MKFLNKYLSYLLVSFSFLIGYSSFVILSPGEDRNNDIKNEIDVDNNTESKNKKVIFDFNDGNLTEDFTVNFESSTQLNLSQSQIESIPEPKYDNITHHFVGWYLTKSGLYEDSTSSLINLSTYDFLESETRVYAKYINQESTKDVTTNSNLTISPSSLDGNTDNVYFLTQSSIGETLVLGSNASINVLYEDGKTFDDTAGNSNKDDLTVARLEDAKVRVILENDLILDGGNITMSSITGYTVSKPGNACPLTTSYTAIDLNGFNIVLLNGANIDGYGIITNSKNTGGIYAKEGTITTIFTILDYKGGGETTGPYIQACSPFFIYACPYFNVECVFTNKSQFIGYSALTTNEQLGGLFGGKYSTYINLINDLSNNASCLLEITDGYLIKNAYSYQFLEEKTVSDVLNNDYINTDSFREGLIFCEYPEKYLKNLDIDFLNKIGINAYSKGIFCMNDISLSINIMSEMKVSLAYADFSVPPFFDISVFSSFIKLNLSINFFKGSSLYVDNDSTIYLNNYISDEGYPIFGRIAFLDAYSTDFRYKAIDTKNNKISTTGNSFYISNKISSSTYESNYKMNGTFAFNPDNIDLTSNYKFYTIGGKLDCSKQTINSLFNNSDKIRLNSSFFLHLNFYIDKGRLQKDNRLGSAYFYQMPLISNDECYFQLSDQTIYVGSMVTDRLIKYNNKYYFYKYDTEQFYSQVINCLSISNVPPNEKEYNIKFDNVKGNFELCEYYNDSVPYIIYGENNNPNYCAYIECCGAFISVETIQENGTYKPNLTSTNKVNINTNASRFGDIDVCKTPSRELLTCVQYSNNVWRFCLND